MESAEGHDSEEECSVDPVYWHLIRLQSEAGLPIEIEGELEPEDARRIAELQAIMQVLDGEQEANFSSSSFASADTHPNPNDASALFHGPSARYSIQRSLGKGGFGIVYLAWDRLLGRQVAVKLPRPELLMTRTNLQRFLREAQVAAQLEHSNIVPQLGTGEADGVPYILYHYCDGPNLLEWSRENRADEAQAVRIAMLLVSGIRHAHSRGILHRDLKPSNILLETGTSHESSVGVTDGTVIRVPRIIDFGISKSVDVTSEETRTGTLLGSIEYMAPEQVRGDHANVGTHSDVFAIGIILYELLTGERLFAGKGVVERLDDLRQRSVPSIRQARRDFSADLDAIVGKCLQPDVRDRYATADELYRDLEAYLQRKPIQARRASVWTRVVRWSQRQPALASLIGLSLLLTSIVIGIYANQFFERMRLNSQLLKKNQELVVERDRANATAKRLALEAYRENLKGAQTAYSAGDLANYQFLLSKSQEIHAIEHNEDPAWTFVWELGHRSSQSLQVSEKPIYAIRPSRDGSTLVCGGEDGELCTIRVSDMSLLHRWPAGQGEVNGVAFSDDGKVASVGDDGTAKIWIPGDDTPIWSQQAHPKALQAMFRTEDHLITTGSDPIICEWNWNGKSKVINFGLHNDSISTLDWNSDRRVLYSGGDDGKRVQYVIPESKAVQVNSDIPHRIVRVALTKSGKYGLYATTEGKVMAETLDNSYWEECLLRLPVGSIEALAVSQEHYAVGTKSGGIYLGRIAATGRAIPIEYASDEHWQTEHGRIFDLQFSTDGELLFSAGADGTCHRWTVSKIRETTAPAVWSRPTFKRAHRLTGTRIHGDRSYCADGNFVYSMVAGRDPHVLLEESAEVVQISFDPEHAILFTGTREGRLIARRLEGNQTTLLWSHSLEASQLRIHCIDYDAVHHQLAVALEANGQLSEVAIFDAQSGQLSQRLEIAKPWNGMSLAPLRYSASGSQLALSIEDQMVLWDRTSENSQPRTFKHPSSILCFDFSPDGTSLVTGAEDGRLRVWSLASGQCQSEMALHRRSVPSVAFSKDGRSLLSTDGVTTVCLWDTADWHCLLEIPWNRPETQLAGQWTMSNIPLQDWHSPALSITMRDLALRSLPKGHDLEPMPGGFVDEGTSSVGKLKWAGNQSLVGIVRYQDRLIVARESAELDGESPIYLSCMDDQGQLDSSFGFRGQAQVPHVGKNQKVRKLLMDSSGRLLILGDRWAKDHFEWFVLRLTKEGLPDETFGILGKVVLADWEMHDNAVDMVCQASGDIIVLGNCGKGGDTVVKLARLKVDGSHDPSFGFNGHAELATPGTDCHGRSLGLDSNDAIFVVGGCSEGLHQSAFLAKFLPDGAIDKTFAEEGIHRCWYQSQTRFECVSCLGHGEVLAAGWIEQTNHGNFAAAKWNAQGTLDERFGAHGLATHEESDAWDIIKELVGTNHGEKALALAISARNGHPAYGLYSFSEGGDFRLVSELFHSGERMDTFEDRQSMRVVQSTTHAFLGFSVRNGTQSRVVIHKIPLERLQ